MSESRRKNFTGEFRAKVAPEAIRGIKTVNENSRLRMELDWLKKTEYFVFYDMERTHQSPGCDTPDQVCRTGSGGGARIADKYSKAEKKHSEMATENRGSAVPLPVKGDPLKLDVSFS